MSLKWDCMDDRNVQEGINDEESNVGRRVCFIKYSLMDFYGMLETVWYLTGLSQKPNLDFKLRLSVFSLDCREILLWQDFIGFMYE